jgi:ubiquinone biosynthesis protein UbiJ
MMKILLGLTVALATISGNVVAENVSTEVKTLVEALQSSTATSGRTILTGSAFSSQVAPHMAAFTALHAEVKAGRVKVADITAIAEKYQFSASQTLQIVVR